MKKKKLLVFQSLLFLTIGTSCNQIKLPNAFVLPNVIIELANYHIDGNVYYYNEYTNSNFMLENDPNYPISLLAGEYYHDIYGNDGELRGNYSINYNQNLETTNGYSDYPQLINTPFRNYSYLKMKLKDMEGFSLESLGGVVTLHGGDVKDNIDASKSTFEIKGILYASDDEKSKILDYFGNRFGYCIIEGNDEFGRPLYGNKLDTEYDNYFDFLNSHLNQYLGYYFDSSSNSIKFSDSLKRNHENQTISFTTEREDRFVRTLEENIYFNGCMTTKEIRNFIDQAEEDIYKDWNSLIFGPYYDAIEYWKGLYNEKVEEIRENNRRINENKRKIEDAYETIENNEKENERLTRENNRLENELEDATENYNDKTSLYNNYITRASSFLDSYTSVSNEMTAISVQIESLEEENSEINKEINILEGMLNNSTLTEEQREQINKKITSLNEEYFNNRGLINSLNSQYNSLSDEAENYDYYYRYYFNLATGAKNSADSYYEEMLDLQTAISENNTIITSNNIENTSLNNSIPKWQEEIENWQNEIDDDLMPKRDDYYGKWKNRENKLAKFKNEFRNNSYEEPNEHLKNEFDLYYENLITQYREDSVEGIQEQFRRGIDEPDIWEWSSDIYNLSGWQMNGDNRTVTEELEKYCSEEVKKYANNTFPSNGNGFYIVPFNMQSNNRYDLALTEYPVDVLTDGFEFGTAFDQMTLVIQFNYDGMVCKNKKALMTCLGAFTFVPTAETYEKDIAYGNYEEWEIKNMESNKEEEETND